MANHPTETSPNAEEAIANQTPTDSGAPAVDQSAGQQAVEKQPVADRSETEPTLSAAIPAEARPQRPADSVSKPVVEVRIGSQRDPANKLLAPSQPKAVREAMSTPVTLSQPVAQKNEPTTTEEKTIPQVARKVEGQAESALPTVPAEVERAVADEPNVATVTVDQLSSQWESDAGELDQISMDDLMSSNTVKQVVDEIPLESRIKGTVSRIHRDDVFFTLKGQHEGVASLRQFKKPPEPGMMTDVIVTGYNAEDSLYTLSIPGAAVSVADWSDINEGSIVEAKITGSNTGGLECMVNNIRGFIPASQISRFRVENLGDYVNQKLTCVVTEANPKRRNLVLSHRAIMERENEEKRQELMKSLEVGNVYDGTVTKLMDFGVFVDIGGVEGLVHISKLAWDRVQHPRDMLEEGQKIKVKIDKVNPETGKISLSHRDTLEHPWDNIDTKYPVGATVKGTVSRLANFGAFVKLESGIEGLIHISELAHSRVQTVKSVLNEGDEVEVKVLGVDREAQKIGLSLKELQPKPEPQEEKKAAEEPTEEIRPVVAKRKKPLKGGTSGKAGGDQFGLKW